MFNYFQTLTSPALKAHVDAQISLAIDLSQRMFDGAQKLNELNVQVVKTLLNESFNTTQKMLTPFNPKDLPPAAEQQPPPVAEKFRAYQQHLQNIFTETQTDVAKTIESHVPETVRAAEEVVTEVVQKVSEETLKVAELQKQTLEKITTPIQ